MTMTLTTPLLIILHPKNVIMGEWSENNGRRQQFWNAATEGISVDMTGQKSLTPAGAARIPILIRPATGLTSGNYTLRLRSWGLIGDPRTNHNEACMVQLSPACTDVAITFEDCDLSVADASHYSFLWENGSAKSITWRRSSVGYAAQYKQMPGCTIGRIDYIDCPGIHHVRALGAVPEPGRIDTQPTTPPADDQVNALQVALRAATEANERLSERLASAQLLLSQRDAWLALYPR
jgi:hypothetical protein